MLGLQEEGRLLVTVGITAWIIIQSLQLAVAPIYSEERSDSAAFLPQRLAESKASLHTSQIIAEQTSSVLPPQCTSYQKRVVRYQLPPKRCEFTEKRAFENRCSFSYASRCPDPIWLTDDSFDTNSQQNHQQDRIAIYVGCNKGMDAVNTLRMMTANETFDKSLWRTIFFASSQTTNSTVHAGHCNQEFSDQYQITNDTNPQKGRVYCIEAMPNSFWHLNQSTHQLRWQDSLHIYNYAMSDTDGYALFPSHQAGNAIGVESLGMSACNSREQRHLCSRVPQRKLDTFVGKEIEPNHLIDILSIDVEGYDWNVLIGASKVLSRVKYLEFEYNWKGPWKQQSLSVAIDTLKTSGFVCYWAGSGGNIWRITDCWQDYFDLKFWSNVACVNPTLNTDVAKRMEGMFEQTLKAGDRIRYHNASSAGTDGRMKWDFKSGRPVPAI